MAADSQASTWFKLQYTCIKAFKVKSHKKSHHKGREVIVTGAGEYKDLSCFKKWIEGSPVGTSFPIKTLNSTLIVADRGEVYQYDREQVKRKFFFTEKSDLFLHPVIVGPIYSCGSGGDYAMGAMLAGASAAEAVEIASRLDLYTGGDIITLEINK